MSGGGGKGGSQTTSSNIPDFVQDASRDALARGSAAGDLGYTPYMGPEIAAFNKAQEAAFNNNAAMAADLGLQGPAGPSMPGAQDFGNGIFGYGSYEPFMGTMDRFREARPGQADYIDSFFIDPVTGEVGSRTSNAIQQQRVAAAPMMGGGGQYYPGMPGLDNNGDGMETFGGGAYEGPNLDGSAGNTGPGAGGLLSDVAGGIRDARDSVRDAFGGGLREDEDGLLSRSRTRSRRR